DGRATRFRPVAQRFMGFLSTAIAARLAGTCPIAGPRFESLKRLERQALASRHEPPVPRRIAQQVGPIHVGLKDVVLAADDIDIESRRSLESSLALSLDARPEGRQHVDGNPRIEQSDAVEMSTGFAKRQGF